MHPLSRPLTDLEQHILDTFTLLGNLVVDPRGRIRRGTPNNMGHRQFSVTFKGKERRFLLNRAVFLLANGWLPNFVGHRDGNCDNNSVANLEAATRQQTQFNRAKHKGTRVKTSSYKGVTLHRGSKWHARIGNRYLGAFATEVEAAKAYDAALPPGFARPNFPVV